MADLLDELDHLVPFDVADVEIRCRDSAQHIGEGRKMAGASPYCPEGNRYCGVPVWKLAVEDFKRVL